jgi:outer membrane lipoprotein SlyB
LILGSLVAAGLSLGACTTTDRYGYDRYGSGYDRYGYSYDRYGNRYDRDGNRVAEGAATGAAVGAVGGAAIGAAIPGVSPIEGAVAGAVAGGLIGAATADDDRRTYGREMRWYRDSRGYCFYVNDRGDRIYDYNVRC